MGAWIASWRPVLAPQLVVAQAWRPFGGDVWCTVAFLGGRPFWFANVSAISWQRRKSSCWLTRYRYARQYGYAAIGYALSLSTLRILEILGDHFGTP